MKTEMRRKFVESEESSVRQFQEQIKYLTTSIAYADKEIPKMKEQIERLTTKLPEWRKELDVVQRSLKTHLSHLSKSRDRYEKALKRDKIRAELKKLEKELTK